MCGGKWIFGCNTEYNGEHLCGYIFVLRQQGLNEQVKPKVDKRPIDWGSDKCSSQLALDRPFLDVRQTTSQRDLACSGIASFKSHFRSVIRPGSQLPDPCLESITRLYGAGKAKSVVLESAWILR